MVESTATYGSCVWVLNEDLKRIIKILWRTIIFINADEYSENLTDNIEKKQLVCLYGHMKWIEEESAINRYHRKGKKEKTRNRLKWFNKSSDRKKMDAGSGHTKCRKWPPILNILLTLTTKEIQNAWKVHFPARIWTQNFLLTTRRRSNQLSYQEIIKC